MAEGRLRAEWNHTASLMAHMCNVAPFRKKGAKLAKPADFHPYARARGRKTRPVSVAKLADEVMKVAESKKRKGKV